MNFKFFKLPDGTKADAVIRTATDPATGLEITSTVPFDIANNDYQEYLEWAKTNTTEFVEVDAE